MQDNVIGCCRSGYKGHRRGHGWAPSPAPRAHSHCEPGSRLWVATKQAQGMNLATRRARGPAVRSCRIWRWLWCQVGLPRCFLTQSAVGTGPGQGSFCSWGSYQGERLVAAPQHEATSIPGLPQPSTGDRAEAAHRMGAGGDLCSQGRVVHGSLTQQAVMAPSIGVNTGAFDT